MKISKRLKEMESIVSDIFGICDSAKNLEDAGDYAEAARTLGSWWRGIGKRPEVDDLPAGKRAAILSRVGALTGWLGSMQQVAGAQEKAKDLISEGANLFETIHDWENWTDARSDLAICYWREGSFDEARVIIQDVLTSGCVFSPELKGKILLRLVTVETSSRQFEAASLLLTKIESLIRDKKSPLLLGKFYFYRAFTLHCQGEGPVNSDLLHLAIDNYKKASLYYGKAKHERYIAMSENNIGNAHRSLGDFAIAHLHLDRALKMYSELKDKGRAAIVYDNKAQAFIAQGELSDAELAAITSVNMLREGGENATLAESLTTLAIVLNRGGNTDEAIRTFNEAKETALMVGDKEGAGNAVLTYIEELRSELSSIVFRRLYLEADELLRDSPKRSNAARLQRIARKYFESGDPESILKKKKYFDWKNFSLPEAVCAYERELILKALNEAGGRVTKAAALLGLSHQNLSSILRQRHKNLLNYSVQRRRRSSLKKSN
jgi:tetratricopeptide (TPR) repeat protein